MYCKEKIYAGTEEFSFEELRAARIFSKIREGTYKPADVKQEQQQNVRCMYPKREVYSFEGEFHYEEILARRYLARRKKYLIAVNESDSKKSTCASSFVESSRGLPSNEDPCPMDMGSCQKNVVKATGKPSYEENNHLTSASQSRWVCCSAFYTLLSHMQNKPAIYIYTSYLSLLLPTCRETFWDRDLVLA